MGPRWGGRKKKGDRMTETGVRICCPAADLTQGRRVLHAAAELR